MAASSICSLLLLLLLLFSIFSISSAISSNYSHDVILLLDKIKPALQGSEVIINTELSSWDQSLPVCQWRGLTWSHSCGGDSARTNLTLISEQSLRLLSLRLPAAALAGVMPPELGDLSSLQSLLLPVNSLSGKLPLELFNSPSLTELDLSGNSFSGSLPPSLWNLCENNITYLKFHSNNISGGIPLPALENSTCNQLRVVDFSSNHFGGDFPEFITDFRGLQQLDLSNNRFDGQLPAALAALPNLQKLNVSFNNFSGELPENFTKFSAAAFEGNSVSLCGGPLGACSSSSAGRGLSSGAVAGLVIGLMAGVVVVASLFIGWVQGRRRTLRARSRDEEELDMELTEDEGGGGGEGRLVVFQGGEHLTLEDVLNATGQVIEKTSYGTVYKAKLADGGSILLRLLREGASIETAACFPAIRQLGRARHENLVALRGFYQGKRGEKLLIYDYLPTRSLHELLHETRTGRPLLNWPRRHKIALGVARALACLHAGHEQPIIHGNVRSKNILLDEFYVPRLTESGLDKLLIPAVADEMVSTAKIEGYKAPELQKMKKCGPRTDVYAYGILLLEILMGRKPGKDGRTGETVDLPALVKAAVLEETTMEVFDVELLKGIRSPAEEGLVQALKLAMGCCAPVPAVRPDMNEVVKQLEENRPRNRSALYSPTTDRSEIGTPLG